MTDPNYLVLVKNLGKMVKLYDDASAGATGRQLTASALVDQAADGLADSWEVIGAITNFYGRLNTAFFAGDTAIKSAALAIAEAYLVTSTVWNYFDTPLDSTTGGTADDVVLALADEMYGDSKTMKTKSATGLINFLNEISATAVIPASGSPTYSDATYCVDAVI